MKRSEMVTIIEYYGLPIEILQSAGIDSLKLADNILKIIEEQGMEPPFNFLKSTEMQTTVNMWDPEDTTCKDCGKATEPGVGSARCQDCWNSRFGEE